MSGIRHSLLALGAFVGGLFAGAAQAQTTDGYHAIQVLPVVVDSTSFSQRIIYRNPNEQAIGVLAHYYAAQGAGQGQALPCNAALVPPRTEFVFNSLRSLCPDMPAGNQFGMLVMQSGSTRTFSVYSRVSNAQGAGFSVEGFAANVFTSAESSVTGLRRLAATANSPAYPSNCFVGNLAQFTPAASPSGHEVILRLKQGPSTIGSTSLQVPPGSQVRLLEVFSAAGAASGDWDGVTAVFSKGVDSAPALIAFCTVQDNTSFGADFRIAKIETSDLGPASPDRLSMRSSEVGEDYRFSGSAEVRQFAIPAGATRNVHTLYFRHPDVINCSLIDPTTGSVATVDYGLEMRLLAQLGDSNAWSVLAGGNDQTDFLGLYLGDKHDLAGGFNSRYMLEVESNGRNAAANRPYKVHCVSGSGHTLGEMSLTGAPLAF